jgi:hypothetical protein
VIWWERQATRESYFWRVLHWILQRCSDDRAKPVDENPTLLATEEEAAAVRAAAAGDHRASNFHAAQLELGRIETMTAATEGPFRLPGHPLSGWTGGMAVEGTGGKTLFERYVASDPGATQRTLTWDAIEINRTKPRGSSGLASFSRRKC